MDLRKDEISALVTGIDDIRIVDCLEGLFDVQDRQFTYYGTKRPFPATIFAMEKK